MVGGCRRHSIIKLFNTCPKITSERNPIRAGQVFAQTGGVDKNRFSKKRSPTHKHNTNNIFFLFPEKGLFHHLFVYVSCKRGEISTEQTNNQTNYLTSTTTGGVPRGGGGLNTGVELLMQSPSWL